MIFKTKRFMYDVFEKNIIGKVGCNAITGSREVGKTTLMLQLEKDNKSNSIYKDASCFDCNFSFKTFYNSCFEQGITNILLDEVCKLNEDLIADFIMNTKLYAGMFCIVISGSVVAVVENMCEDISRGETYVLPPIMYIERLCWNLGYNRVNIDIISKYSSYEKFINYIKFQNTSTAVEQEGYIVSVVKDTLTSYLRNTAMDDFYVDMSKEDFQNVVKYISLCQFVYTKDKTILVDLPYLSENIRNIIGAEYKNYKRNWNISSKQVGYVYSVLYGCHLAKQTAIYRGNNLLMESVKLDSDCAEACIFEYPWLSTICLTDFLWDNNSLIDIWVENAILLRELYIYSFVDKARFEGNEMDTVYGVGDLSVKGYYGLEVKNRTSKNISNSYLQNEREFAESLGLNKIEFTSLNDEKGFLRVDKVIASLELEYMNLLLNGDVRCDKTIGELVSKYFG